jgi:hypothetical protein
MTDQHETLAQDAARLLGAVTTRATPAAIAIAKAAESLLGVVPSAARTAQQASAFERQRSAMVETQSGGLAAKFRRLFGGKP